MSLLWENKKKKENKKGDNAEFGIPKFLTLIKLLAQDSLSKSFGCITQRFSIQKITKKIRKNSIKGISAHASQRLSGSMTVEASLVLPLFILFFLQVGSIMEMMRFHGKMEVALWEVGRETNLYATAITSGLAAKQGQVATNEAGQLREKLGNLVLAYTYVKGRVENYLGKEYLSSAPVKDGPNGLQYVGSEILKENDQVELVVTYLAYPKWFLEKYFPFAMENHYVGRLWTGYEIPKERETGYYLAENMEVFHRDRDCTHLFLRARRVKWESMLLSLNAKGKSYRACKKCVEGEQLDFVWIAPEGDCFHARENCPGLKRTVREVSMEEALHYRPCTRCGKYDD